MILQLNPQINIHTPLGEAHAFFIIDYGQWVNTVWVARICGTGEVKHFDANDIKIEGNPTLDEKLLVALKIESSSDTNVMESYGWVASSFEESGSWEIEGGEQAYYKMMQELEDDKHKY